MNVLSNHPGGSPAGGYSHPDYAQSLAEFGAPRELPRSGGWILERPIPGSPYRDAMGCYPVFSCLDWSRLQQDLDDIGQSLVSLAVVTDPFGETDPGRLRQCFGDVVKPFKEHVVIDLTHAPGDTVRKRHREHARRALRRLQVEVLPDPAQFVGEWTALYRAIAEKYSLAGIKAFSRDAFARQLGMGGTVVLAARHEGQIVGAQIYFVHRDAVYCHLGASSETGYQLGAYYALDWASIEHFHGKAHWLDLGGGAGVSVGGTDGLRQYKSGWSTETRQVYFCGRVFHPARYAELAGAAGGSAIDYFPIYRAGEFR